MRRITPLFGLLVSAVALRAAGVYEGDADEFRGDVRLGRSDLPRIGRHRLPAGASPFEEDETPARARTGAKPTPAPKDKPAPVPVPVTPPEAEKPAAPAPAAPVPDAPKEPTVPELLEQKRFGAIAVIADKNKDGKLAGALAWAYYREQNYADAGVWFSKAAEWSGSDDDIVFGRAVAALGDGKPDEARRLVRPILNHEERARLLYADLGAERASREYEEGRYREAATLLTESYRYRYLTTNEQLMLAWCRLRTGDTAEAGRIFEGLYRATRSRESADGLIAVEGETKEGRERLVALAKELGGPLEQNRMIAGSESHASPAMREFNAGRHIQAVADAPELEPRARGVAGTAAYLGGSYVARSGRPGLEKLQTAKIPLGGVKTVLFDRHELDFRATAVSLRSDKPSNESPIGTPPVIPVTFPPTPVPAFPHKATDHVDGYDLLLNYRYHDDVSPYASIGISPEGPIAPEPNARGGVTWFGDHTTFDIQGFYQPVTDSLLSYTGIRDPWTGEKWGRVMSIGGKLGASIDVEDNWSLGLGATGAYLQGKHVRDNVMGNAAVSLRRTIPSDHFAYLAVGPDLSFTHYDRNLSKFTYGQGGYFSPDALMTLDLGVNLLTREGRRWLLKADTIVGYQTNQQNSTPYYPLNKDGQSYPDASASSMVFAVRTEGGFLISEHWMVGGFIDYNKAPNFNSFGLGLYFSFLFSKREGLYRQDLQTPVW